MSEAGKVSLPVKVARLPEESITELDERIDELWRDEGGDYETEEYITDDMMSTFNLLTIGYDAAWSEVERLSAALKEAAEEYDKRTSYYRGELRAGAREMAEAQQTIARLTAALIAERDAALIWDGIGTVNRINEALGERS